MKKEMILGLISLLMLLFLALPVTSAHIDIIDIGSGYDMIEHYGYVSYQNTVDYNVSGAILVFIDGDIVAGKILNMPIRYVAGFRCSPVKTFEFSLSEMEGDHTIVVYVLSMNSSVQRAYEYYAEDWWVEQEDIVCEVDAEEDWLTCWRYE